MFGCREDGLHLGLLLPQTGELGGFAHNLLGSQARGFARYVLGYGEFRGRVGETDRIASPTCRINPRSQRAKRREGQVQLFPKLD